MTRILVQRGSGSSSSSQPRSSTTSSSSSVSAAPTPPPLPPPYVPPSAFHSPHNLSRSAAASSSSRIWEEVALKDSWDVEPCAVCEEFQSTSSDTNFRFIACHYSDSKVKGRESEGNVQDDGSAEGHNTNEIEGKEQQMTVPVSFIIEEGQQGDIEFPDQGAEVSFSGDCRVASFEFERLRMHEEDLGSQKILVDTVIEQKHEGEEVCLQTGQNRVQSSPVQYCTQCNTQPGNPLCSHQLPRLSQGSSQSQGLGASSMPTFSSALPSLPLPGGSDIGPLRGHEDIDQPRLSSSQKMADTATCSYIPPCALPVPPPPRRGNWVGSSASSGSRAGGSSRRVSRNIKDSRSSPHSSRSTSPRSYGEGDGYNSADEQNPWGSGPSMFEDSDERERQFDMDIRRTKGLEVRRMSEDGNCLFRAVADQVYGDADMHEETRQLCIDYMEKERDHFSQFVTESFTAYCKRKRRDKVYGNNLEIQAMAEMYNRPIHIYSYGTEPINIFQGSYETDLPPIRLSYHRGHHYNSLVDPSRPTIGAGLGFGSLRGANIDRDQVKAALKAQQDQQIEKALLAEGRYYSDLELTEHEMEQMVMEASRAEFLAESHRQQLGWVESSTSARAEPSSSGAIGTSNSHGDILDVSQPQRQGAHNSSPYLGAAADPGLTSNMRTLLSMGFSYLRVLEAYSIFGDDVNDMLCYLLEADTSSPGEGSTHRMKGKAAER